MEMKKLSLAALAALAAVGLASAAIAEVKNDATIASLESQLAITAAHQLT